MISYKTTPQLNKFPTLYLDSGSFFVVMITEAILHHGEPCPFEKIYEYVNTRWKGMKIRRRDGTPYATDCRRAIQANLRHNPNHICLFKKDTRQAQCWRLCYTLDDAAKQKEKYVLEKEKSHNEKEKQNSEKEKHFSEKEKSVPEKEKQFPEKEKLNFRRSGLSGSTSVRTRSQMRNATNGKHNGLRLLSILDLNELQTLISYALEEGKTGSVTGITTFVVKLIQNLRRGPKLQTSPPPPKERELRKAIIFTLGKNVHSSPIFMRDPTNYLQWKFNHNHPWLTASQDEKGYKLHMVNETIANSKDGNFIMEDVKLSLRGSGSG